MAELEARLQEANDAGAKFKLIATDGVFLWTVLSLICQPCVI